MFQMLNANFEQNAPKVESDLGAMLTYCRPHRSKAEKAFIKRFILPLEVERDGFGNLTKRIGRAPIIWSCHTDTVHKWSGTQVVHQEGDLIQLYKPNKHAGCLGADDTAGVWLMREMIQAKVEGLYIFHRGEESYGLGSGWLIKHTPNLVKDYSCAIALDRKGTSDVITHQGSRCCSDEFAKSLASQLGGAYKPDPTGIFTDTANYTELVGECTNISVGYAKNHTIGETLDTKFLYELREKLFSIDPAKLVFKRKPGENDPFDDYFFAQYGTKGIVGKSIVGSKFDWLDDDATNNDWWREDLRPSTLEGVVRRYPDEVADMLEDYGINAHDVLDYIEQMNGRIPSSRR